MTYIDIAYEEDAETVRIDYNGLRLVAETEPNGKISFSENWEEIDDEKMYKGLQAFAKYLLK